MTTYYIDPDHTGSNSGTLLNPWQSWTDVSWEDNGEYLMKRGTEEDLGGTSIITGIDLSNITTGAYSEGDGSDDKGLPKPIIESYKTSTDFTGSWVSTEWTNVWARQLSGIEQWDPILLFGIDQLTKPGKRTQFINNIELMVEEVVNLGSPMRLKITGHGLSQDDKIWLVSPKGGTDVSGSYVVDYVDANNIEIDVAGSGTYTLNTGVVIDVYTGQYNWPPSEYGEHDVYNGLYDTGESVGYDPVLFIYATSNPGTFYNELYWALNSDCPFTFRRWTNTLEIKDIHFRYAATPIAINLGWSSTSTLGKLWVHDLECNDMWYGINIIVGFHATQFWLDGSIIEHNYIHNTRAGGVEGLGYHKNLHVRYNLIHDCLHSWSGGGIYFGAGKTPDGEENYLYGNEVYNMVSGVYWNLDGACIMMEQTTSNNIILRNYVHDAELGLIDNSGKNSIWSFNIIENCDFGFKQSDAPPATAGDELDVYVTNNTFINCGGDKYQGTAGWVKGPAVRINSSSTQTDPAPYAEVSNNIIVGSDYDLLIGIDIMSNLTTNGSYTESGNCFYNCTSLNLGESSVYTPIDSTSREAEPLLDEQFYPTKKSPCIGTGVAMLYNHDYYTRGITRNNTIGAVFPKTNKKGTRRNKIRTRDRSRRNA